MSQNWSLPFKKSNFVMRRARPTQKDQKLPAYCSSEYGISVPVQVSFEVAEALTSELAVLLIAELAVSLAVSLAELLTLEVGLKEALGNRVGGTEGAEVGQLSLLS
jgi:hypothetical protein